MSAHPNAGKPVAPEDLTDIAQLVSCYYEGRPDVGNPDQRVSFGTSGHRGSSLNTSFNEAHILAITEAICEYRQEKGITGPLFMGKDTHALSAPAEKSALRVFAARGVTVMFEGEQGYTPTPVISHAILCHNRDRSEGLADGVVITPSHNPPDNGGIKYNPPNGGPADTDATGWIAARANELLADSAFSAPALSFAEALDCDTTIIHDFMTPYVEDLQNVVDVEAIAASGSRIVAMSFCEPRSWGNMLSS